MAAFPCVLVICACASAPLFALQAAAPFGDAEWSAIQQKKHEQLASCAQHAMEQQKRDATAPVPLPFPDDVAAQGNVTVVGRSAGALSVEATASPSEGSKPAADCIRIRLGRALDMVTQHSGLALTVETREGASPEVRLGCRLYAPGAERCVTIEPIVPVVDAWGDSRHEIYLDWSFLNYENELDAADVLRSVDTIELTLAGRLRAPQRGPSASAAKAAFTISDLRLVDYLQGSYDPSRQWLEFDREDQKWKPGQGRDLTLQHRCQEATGIVALFGGDAGVASAIEALDMAVRTQCWDGSFLDGRRGAVTVASGEYTFGFTIYGLLCGYVALEEKDHPALAQKITIGPTTMSRREFYQRMFYRGAMARTVVPISQYRDDIIGGNTLITGANRVLGYAIAMRMVADALSDQRLKAQVLEKYEVVIGEITDAQGRFSGGFPLLGEGDRYQGRGIHYDAGYIRTHMDWLVLGVERTGDPRLVTMLKRYSQVIEASMDQTGLGILPLISERGRGSRPVGLILPDATAQVGMKYGLPIIAQWGYNCRAALCRQEAGGVPDHFASAAGSRGYSLAAHMSILVDDVVPQPLPRDLGYMFPRQYPIWSSRLFTKDGTLVRTSSIVVHPDGTAESDFRIEVGEYLSTVGVPVSVKSPEGTVTATADRLSGWPRLLPDDARIQISGDLTASGRIGEALRFTLNGPAHVVITGPEVQLPPEAGGERTPFGAELTLTPEKPGLPIELTVLGGRLL